MRRLLLPPLLTSLPLLPLLCLPPPTSALQPPQPSHRTPRNSRSPPSSPRRARNPYRSRDYEPFDEFAPSKERRRDPRYARSSERDASRSSSYPSASSPSTSSSSPTKVWTSEVSGGQASFFSRKSFEALGASSTLVEALRACGASKPSHVQVNDFNPPLLRLAPSPSPLPPPRSPLPPSPSPSSLPPIPSPLPLSPLPPPYPLSSSSLSLSPTRGSSSQIRKLPHHRTILRAGSNVLSFLNLSPLCIAVIFSSSRTLLRSQAHAQAHSHMHTPSYSDSRTPNSTLHCTLDPTITYKRYSYSEQFLRTLQPILTPTLALAHYNCTLTTASRSLADAHDTHTHSHSHSLVKLTLPLTPTLTHTCTPFPYHSHLAY